MITWLKVLRMQRGKLGMAMARGLGVADSTYYCYELRRRKPDALDRATIARLLATSEILLFDKDGMARKVEDDDIFFIDGGMQEEGMEHK